MAVAKRLFKKYTEGLVREIEVGTNKPEHTLVLDGTRPAVTLAASSGSKVVKELPDGSTISKPIQGVGFRPGCATVAYDGTWLFPVAGLTAGETVPASAAGTDRGTKVYLKEDGGLTLTVGTNTYIGIIDDGYITGGVAPVQIGVPA